MVTYLNADDADYYMAYLIVFPAMMSIVGCMFTFMMCYFLSHNYAYFPTKILMRICFVVGAYSGCLLWNPGHESDHAHHLSSAIEVFPVINSKCYVQSALVIAFENLGCFWQCCLIHCVYEVSVKKNLRPEDLLTAYDNWSILFALLFALFPWGIDAYGWQWYGRCKYNTLDSGSAASLFNAASHLLVVIYILASSVRLYKKLARDEQMTTDYLALPGMQRRWKQQVKYIWISNAFVICKLPGMITNALEAFQLLGSGDFYTRPDDIPFFLIALESLSNDGFGIALFCIFLVFDVNKVRTRVVKCMPCIKDVYCLNKKFSYELEGRTISDGDISDAREQDNQNYEFIALKNDKDPLASPKGAASSGSFDSTCDSACAKSHTGFAKLLMSKKELECYVEGEEMDRGEEPTFGERDYTSADSNSDMQTEVY